MDQFPLRNCVLLLGPTNSPYKILQHPCRNPNTITKLVTTVQHNFLEELAPHQP